MCSSLFPQILLLQNRWPILIYQISRELGQTHESLQLLKKRKMLQKYGKNYYLLASPFFFFASLFCFGFFGGFFWFVFVFLFNFFSPLKANKQNHKNNDRMAGVGRDSTAGHSAPDVASPGQSTGGGSPPVNCWPHSLMHPRNPSSSLATRTQSPPEHFQTWKSIQRSLRQHTVCTMGYCDYLNCA